METEKLKEIAKIQKQFHKDIETVRNEERKICTVEIEQIKNSYMSKQRETSSELMKLEQSHQSRIQSLEDQLAKSSSHQQEIISRIKIYEDENHHLVDEIKRLSALHIEKVDSLNKHIKKLSQALEEAKNSEIEAKNQKVAMQEQYEATFKANHLMKIQLHESKRQVSERHALAEQWRKAVEEIEHSHGAKETALKIAREEIMMLEHEIKRMSDEKAVMSQQLEYYHRLVYGTSNTSISSPIIGNVSKPSIKNISNLSSMSSSTLTSPYVAKRSLLMAANSSSASALHDRSALTIPLTDIINTSAKISSSKSSNQRSKTKSNAGHKKKENRSLLSNRSQSISRSLLTESSFNSRHQPLDRSIRTIQTR